MAQPSFVPAPAEHSLAPRRGYRIAGVAAAVVGLGALVALSAHGSEVSDSAALALSSAAVPPAPTPLRTAPAEVPRLAPAVDVATESPAGEPATPDDAAVIEEHTVEDHDESDDEPLDSDPAIEVDAEHSSLRDWTHPLAGTESAVPTSSSRRFGAERPGSRPSECGAGHCGVDLGGPIGTPIVSVLAGVVVRVEHRSNRRSGRYVRVRHSGGVVTWYMHLDEIAGGLEVGTPVKAGQRLGSLGKTGIRSSEPHLHFAVQAPRETGSSRYVDPEPMLGAAEILDPLDVIESLGDLEM